ncbi:MAG: thiamine pyrophosphate-binding protein [Nocardioides sp.]|uniref:thiamine pyrophosphate-binding protein n=1 Tax=Nocardioides sp. TaxID=35761 RepID=UPI0039E6A749
MQTNAQSIARVLAEYGSTRVFTLMGDGNMHLILALDTAGIIPVEVRHESAAVAMAEGYGWSSGRVGICSTTHGPGLSHTATSLLVAARNRSPLVLLVGETADGYAGAQHFDQRRFVEACEAVYRRVTAGDDAGSVVASAIADASALCRPVVVGIPSDLLEAARGDRLAKPESPAAPPAAVADVAAAADAVHGALAAAARPIILAGRGAVQAQDELIDLAQTSGAGLATTLPAKGLFDGHDNDLGIAGGLTSPDAEPVFARADLVLAFGTSLGASTTRSGRLFSSARVLRVERNPERAAGSAVPAILGDAAAVATAAARRHRERGVAGRWFPACRAWPENWRTELDEFAPELAPDTVDPRIAVIEIDRRLPHDAVIVISNGHCSGFASALVRTSRPRRLHLAQGFGAIGQGLTTAVGVALGAPERHVVVFEGDAGFMMHAQELETARRVGAHLTAIVFNDEALGTEYHRLHHEGEGADLALVPTPEIATMARSAGVDAVRVASQADVRDAIDRVLAAPIGLLELRTSRSVESRHLRWRRLPDPSERPMERGRVGRGA